MQQGPNPTVEGKIPTAQRQRIQMVLLRASGMAQPAIAAAMGVSLSTDRICVYLIMPTSNRACFQTFLTVLSRRFARRDMGFDH